MIRKFLIIAFLAVGMLLVNPLPSSAAKDILNPPDGTGGSVCNGKEDGNPVNPNNSAVCKDRTGNNPLTGENGLFAKATNVVAFVAGVAAVILILIGSVRYITSDGDSGKIASAKGTILGALIGIVIIVVARSLIIFVVNRL